MGQSTDGILFYGVALREDDGPFPWGDDFDKWLAAQSGVTEPTEEFSEVTKPLFREYWDRQRDAVKKAPVELVIHCSGDYPMYGLAIRGTRTTACRGDVVSVSLREITPEEQAAFKAFLCEHACYKGEASVGWKLVSYWG